ncbi:uncharacterized protein LOC129789774 [Lutzomyia longipalpis]|uniref:uncharacterized protein LOC129789774 n=1 Tax=Lutzomyia longipalpis TaxID=7200 RepID=UPI002483814B|nr:uncharacterized protein LOC129789774 [Lutzomyia longipalpis]
MSLLFEAFESLPAGLDTPCPSVTPTPPVTSEYDNPSILVAVFTFVEVWRCNLRSCATLSLRSDVLCLFSCSRVPTRTLNTLRSPMAKGLCMAISLALRTLDNLLRWTRRLHLHHVTQQARDLVNLLVVVCSSDFNKEERQGELCAPLLNIVHTHNIVS